MVDIKITLAHHKCTQRFYVCEDDVTPLIGRRCMRAQGIVIDLEKNKVTIKGKQITTYDLHGAKISNRVCLLNTLTIKPGHEIQLPARVVGKGRPDGVTCYVEPAHVFRMRTGTLVARTLTIPRDNICNIRMVNPHDEPVRLWRGMTLGILKQSEQTCR